jgi:MFS transporter, BCD family, chlorophyll transporter
MSLSWLQIVRLGLVQMALGAIVVLTTSTLNRLMVVELALPAVLPGMLVALHYGIQITRPNWGFLSDTGGRRTLFIIGGMAALGAGALTAALAIAVFETSFAAGLAVSIFAYALIGLGVGASGTALLALLATATGTAAAGGGGDDHLAHDGLRHRGDGRDGRRASRALQPRPPRRDRGFVAGAR